MSRVVCDLGVSLDGYVAGPRQSLETPMGEGRERLLRWRFEAPQESAGETAAILDAGAFVMGRNMFGPVRGPWDSWPQEWRGWWGETPPYAAPVFVLTHFERDPLIMDGTTFFFVTDGLAGALDRARDAAGERDVSIAGGASTVNQALTAGVIDELRLHVAPVTLGAGQRLFDGVPPLDLDLVGSRSTSLVTHLTYRLR